MSLAQENMTFGAQEYLTWEAGQIDKHEYVAGETAVANFSPELNPMNRSA